jgi:hypothetical protein
MRAVLPALVVVGLLLLTATPALAVRHSDVDALPGQVPGGWSSTIGITAVEASGAALDPKRACYDLEQPADVSTTIIWNDASSVDSIADSTGHHLVRNAQYGVGFLNAVATLTITDAYLSGELLEAGDEVELTVNFDRYSPAVLTITAIAGEANPRYTLTISSIAGGSVVEPGEGAFAYEAGTVVELVARPDEHYGFLRWTGDVDTIADVTAASTSVTMQSSYNITASFGEQIAFRRSFSCPLIAGAAAGIIAAGLVVFFLRRRRARRMSVS